MPEAPFQPPNPRHSRYRQMEVPKSLFPMTMLLIGLSVGVALISQFGKNTDPVRGLFFADRPSMEEIQQLETMVKKITPDGEDAAIDPAAMEYMQHALEKFGMLNANPFKDIEKGQVWRLVTPIFLHFGPIHLIFNMMWLWQLGRVLEATFRSFRFGLLVAAIAVISNCTQAHFKGINFGGMSGVVYGLFGFVVIRSKYHPAPTFSLSPQTVRYMLLWLVLCFTGMFGPIANYAHVSGLVAGGLLGSVNALMGGGWDRLRRRQQFFSAMQTSTNALHRCAVCGVTERDNPMLDFRVSADGEEYCEQHLPPQ